MRVALTAAILKVPITKDRIPEAIRIRHIGKPKDSWLVASLFKFPSMLRPTTTIASPRKTKPWS